MQLCKLLSEMPIDLHKLVANYLRKNKHFSVLKDHVMGGERRGGGRGTQVLTSVKAL